jgi:hypothetical protein
MPFSIQDSANPLECKCVDCKEDELCGGLWKGENKYTGENKNNAKKVHMIVSHCMNDLYWLLDYTKGYNVTSIHVVSKSGHPVRGAPEAATIEVMLNIGRCDHTYAYFITTILDKKLENDNEEDAVVILSKMIPATVICTNLAV